MPDLRVVLETPSPRDEAMLAWIAEWLGLRLAIVAPGGPDPVLYRGAQPPAGTTGIVVPSRPADRLWADLLSGRVSGDALPAQLPFDVIGAMAAHLDDVENQGSQGRDRHDRLEYRSSYAAAHGFGQVPIVNRYLEALAVLVERELGLRGEARWPEGKQAAIALSHDVDRPVKWGALRGFGAARRPALRHLPLYGAKVGWTLLQRLRAGTKDDFWLFEPLVAAEAERGFRSTFLFAATPAFASRGTPDDVYYDIAWPRFASAFDLIRERGFEIGLHAGYDAHRSLERLVGERDRLTLFLGRGVRGLRHHFWHLGPDERATLRLHEEAGFAWDSSLAFNDHPGFRRSVALPFHPWDAAMGRPLATLQLPTICMDGTLFRSGWSSEQAAAEVGQLIETVVGVGGFGALDWHVRTSLPLNREFRDWGETYLATLDRLAADDRIWVTSLDAAATWVTERRRRIAETP